MALGGTAQPATTATSKSFAEHPSKQLIGKYLMEDVKAALAFVHSRASLVLRSMNCRSCPASLMTSQTSREAWECLKADAARLVTCPVFWLLLLLGGISCAVASAAALLWVICAPLILRNSDFQTWALREDPEKFKGKVVWVTGGSTGIGLSLCRQLATRGVKGLILTSRSLPRLEKAREQILSYAESQGASLKEKDILLLPLDLSKGLRPEAGQEEAAAAAAWEQTVQAAIQWRGGVDILFNNAGRLAVGCLPPTETFSEVMDSNFLSVIKLTNLLLPHMRSKNQGHIVFTNSSSGEVLGMVSTLYSAYFSFGGFNAYATSKVALLSFANLLRQDLRGCGFKGVLVTSVHPGYIQTNLHQNICDSLVDSSCSRSATVQWNWSGLDVDLASLLILRAVSRDLEEAWMALPTGLLQMYVGFYVPHLVQFVRRFTAKKECALTSEYREAVVSQLTGGDSNGNRSK